MESSREASRSQLWELNNEQAIMLDSGVCEGRRGGDGRGRRDEEGECFSDAQIMCHRCHRSPAPHASRDVERAVRTPGAVIDRCQTVAGLVRTLRRAPNKPACEL